METLHLEGFTSDNSRNRYSAKSDISVKIASLSAAGLNGEEIAKQIGRTRQRVNQILRSLGTKKQPRKTAATCALCGTLVVRYRSLMAGRKLIFCSRSHAKEFQKSSYQTQCSVCGKPVARHMSKSPRRAFCSQACYHSVRQQRPYVPHRQGQRIARKAVAQHFPLQPGNVVHHHDGDNTNNALSNLAVFRNQADHMAHHHGSDVQPLWDGRRANA